MFLLSTKPQNGKTSRTELSSFRSFPNFWQIFFGFCVAKNTMILRWIRDTCASVIYKFSIRTERFWKLMLVLAGNKSRSYQCFKGSKRLRDFFMSGSLPSCKNKPKIVRCPNKRASDDKSFYRSKRKAVKRKDSLNIFCKGRNCKAQIWRWPPWGCCEGMTVRCGFWYTPWPSRRSITRSGPSLFTPFWAVFWAPGCWPGGSGWPFVQRPKKQRLVVWMLLV